MADNIWTGDAQPIAREVKWIATNAIIGRTFTAEIGTKTATYILTQADVDDAEGTQSLSSVAMRGIYAAIQDLVALEITEFSELTFSLVTDEENTDEVTWILVLGLDSGRPFTATLVGSGSGVTVEVSVTQHGSAGQNEIQVVSIGTPTGGTFTLSFGGVVTGNIAYNASAATVDAALEALSNIGAGDVAVTGSAGGPWTVEFQTALAETNVNTLIIDGTLLTGSRGVSEVAYLCNEAESGGPNQFTLQGNTSVSAGTFTLAIEIGGTTYTTAAIAYGATVREVQLAIEVALDAINGCVVNVTSGDIWDSVMNSTATLVTFQLSTIYLRAITSGTGFTAVTLNSSLTGGTYTATVIASSSADYASGDLWYLRLGPVGTATSVFSGGETAAVVQAALEALPEIGAGNVLVTSPGTGADAQIRSGLFVAFINDLASTSLVDLELVQTTFTSSNDRYSCYIQIQGEDAEVATSVSVTQNGLPAQNEIQVVSFAETVASGTFTLTYSGQTTSAIAYDASAATVDAALEALSNIGAGDVLVSGSAGGPWTVEFQTALAETNVVLMTGSGASLVSANPSDFSETVVTAASGPNHFYHADNWTLGLPVDDQDLHWRDSDVPCLFDLEYASITPASLHFWASYTADIGLPDHNGDYQEYLPVRLKLGTSGDGSAGTIAVYVGEGEGTGSTRIRLNTGTKQTTLIQQHTSTSEDGVTPVVDWIGTHASNRVEVYRGSFGSTIKPGEASTILNLLQAHRGNVDTDATVRIGAGCTLGTIEKTGGSLIVATASGGSVTQFTNSAGDAEITGAGDVRKCVFRGGTIISKTSGVLGQYKAITGATAANPCVITSTAHGLTTGDKIRIGGVVGMTELNQVEYYVVVVNANSFQLAGINSSAYTAYSSGGYWGRCGSIEVAGEAVLEFGYSLADRYVAAEIDVYGEAARVSNPEKHVTAISFLSGEFAIRYHYSGPTAGLPSDGLVVFR